MESVTVREFLEEYQKNKYLKEIVVKTEYGIAFWGTIQTFNDIPPGSLMAKIERWKVAKIYEAVQSGRVLIEV